MPARKNKQHQLMKHKMTLAGKAWMQGAKGAYGYRLPSGLDFKQGVNFEGRVRHAQRNAARKGGE